MKEKLKVSIAGDLTIFSSQNALIKALKEQGHEYYEYTSLKAFKDEYSEDLTLEVDILILNHPEEFILGFTMIRARVYRIEILSEKEAISRLNLKVS